jgi:hypothetical protein
VLLLLLPGLATAATMPASGSFVQTSFVQTNVRTVNGVTLFDFTETDALTGTFVGTTVIEGSCVVRSTGAGTCVARETLTGSVAGRTGTAVFQDFIALEPDGTAHGHFAVVDGTGNLVSLHGSGTFQGVGGSGTYEGHIVFAR